MTKDMKLNNIKSKIYEIRSQKVMLDRDLAELYGITTGNLNKAVTRNIDRFPDDFMFKLETEEYDSLRFQNGSLKRGAHSKYLPNVFTELGVSMLSSVLKSKVAVQVNIQIIRTFVEFRHAIASKNSMEEKLEAIESRLDIHDQKHKEIFAFIQASMNDENTSLL